MHGNMKVLLVAASLLAAVGGAGCSKRTTAPKFSVQPAFVETAVGGVVAFHMVNATAPSGWEILAGRQGYLSLGGNYYAPLEVPGDGLVSVRAASAGRTAEATVRVKPGTVTAAQCAGPSQNGTPPPADQFVIAEDLPVAIDRIAPAYPGAAIAAGVEGLVTVRARVCACGGIDATVMAKSIPLLDDAAVAAARQWTFRPGLSGHEPVALWVDIPMLFVLNGPGGAPSVTTGPMTAAAR